VVNYCLLTIGQVVYYLLLTIRWFFVNHILLTIRIVNISCCSLVNDIPLTISLFLFLEYGLVINYLLLTTSHLSLSFHLFRSQLSHLDHWFSSSVSTDYSSMFNFIK